MELKLMSSAKSGTNFKVSDAIFGRRLNEGLVHQVVTAYMAGGRQGTRQQKNRSDVRGGGIKPWRQKGTGRARAGTIRSPIWRGGGVTFAARPQDHSVKVNKKMYRAAMQCILSELARTERLILVKELKLAKPKTKEMVALLQKFDLDNVLIVTEDLDKNLYLATRNLHKVDVIDSNAIDPVSLIKHEKVVMTEEALKQVQQQLG